tara:strand:+ start:4232 stop:4396 length:165 start_codon:yes stop_codon:yes gene_type:complete
MECYNCEYPMEEIEFGDSSSDETEVGYECEVCEHTVCPDSLGDYALNSWYGEII